MQINLWIGHDQTEWSYTVDVDWCSTDLFSTFLRYSSVVPSPPSQLEARSISLTSIIVYWKPPREPRGQLNSIVYEIYYTESTGFFKNVTVNSTQDHSKLQKLMSDTLYLIKIRAGRQVDGTLRWSNYRRISARTHQTGRNSSIKSRSQRRFTAISTAISPFGGCEWAHFVLIFATGQSSLQTLEW